VSGGVGVATSILPDLSDWISLSHAARIAGTTLKTIWMYGNNGFIRTLPAGNIRLYYKPDVDKYADLRQGGTKRMPAHTTKPA
jgi:hypothetical protein